MDLKARFPESGAWYVLAVLLTLVLLRGLWIDVMDVDASQYASIAMEMLQNGSWLQVQHRGADYLDKPPLLFWTSAASFGLFGLHNWAYKLPSLLAAAAGVFAVYRFSRLFYPAGTARNAAFILAAALGFIVVCNDVRTDTLLLGATACAVWQLAEYIQKPRWTALVAAFLFIGLAMLAKGPIGLILPVFAVGAHVLLQRDFKQIFRWQWLAGLLVTALTLAPMCWGLYQQFDQHPEKLINGRTGVSGLYFFFWEQSFGRITGENVWKNNAGPFYFFHVYLWAFLPWALLFYVLLLRRLGKLLPEKFRLPAAAEGYSLGAFVLSFTALSLSKYKLPHYIFITLPWAAVLTATGIDTVRGKKWPWLALYAALSLVLAVAWAVPLFVFPAASWGVWAPLATLSGWLLYRIFREPFPGNSALLVQRGMLGITTAAFVLNFHFYPNLLAYQSTSALMHRAKTEGIEADRLAFYLRHGHALDFYAGRILPAMTTPAEVQTFANQNDTVWIYTTAAGKAQLDSAGVQGTVAISTQHFQAALLKAPFLNPATREKVLEPVFLLKVAKESAK